MAPINKQSKGLRQTSLTQFAKKIPKAPQGARPSPSGLSNSSVVPSSQADELDTLITPKPKRRKVSHPEPRPPLPPIAVAEQAAQERRHQSPITARLSSPDDFNLISASTTSSSNAELPPFGSTLPSSPNMSAPSPPSSFIASRSPSSPCATSENHTDFSSLPHVLDEDTKTAAFIKQVRQAAARTSELPDSSDSEKDYEDLDPLTDDDEQSEEETFKSLFAKDRPLVRNDSCLSGTMSPLTSLTSEPESDDDASRRPRRDTGCPPPVRRSSRLAEKPANTCGVTTGPKVSLKRKKVEVVIETRAPLGNGPINVDRQKLKESKQKENFFNKMLEEKAREEKVKETLQVLEKEEMEVQRTTPPHTPPSRPTADGDDPPRITLDGPPDKDGAELDKEEMDRLLGSDIGMEVNKFLHEKTPERNRIDPVVPRERLGVRFWSETGADSNPFLMDTSPDGGFAVPQLNQSEGRFDAILKNCSNDKAALRSLLNLADPVLLPRTPDFLLWLLELAVLSNDGSLASMACRMLFILSRSASYCKPPVGTEVGLEGLLLIFAKLGADPEILKLHDLQPPSNPRQEVDSSLRGPALYRLVHGIRDLHSLGVFAEGTQVQLSTLLLLVALDPTSETSLRREITATLGLLYLPIMVAQIANDPKSRCLCERQICENFLRISCPNPSTMVFMLSLLPVGTVEGWRVTQWVAWGMLMQVWGRQTSPDPDTPSPPLDDAIIMLSNTWASSHNELSNPFGTPRKSVSFSDYSQDPSSSSQSFPSSQTYVPSSATHVSPFALLRNADRDETNYVDLRAHIEVLSYYLTNVATYVEIEKAAQSSASAASSPRTAPESPTRSSPKKTRLERIPDLLDTLGGRIVDTNGIQMDRSYAKASLQRLSLRVRYQRLSSNSKSGRGRFDSVYGPSRTGGRGVRDDLRTWVLQPKTPKK